MGGGQGGDCPPGRNSAPPLATQMKLHFVQMSMESCHFESQSAPLAHPWAPLAAPSFWKVWLCPCEVEIHTSKPMTWPIYQWNPSAWASEGKTKMERHKNLNYKNLKMKIWFPKLPKSISTSYLFTLLVNWWGGVLWVCFVIQFSTKTHTKYIVDVIQCGIERTILQRIL